MNTKSNDGGHLPRKFGEEYSDEFRRLNLLTTGLANEQIERAARAAAFRMAKYGARRSKQLAQEIDEQIRSAFAEGSPEIAEWNEIMQGWDSSTAD
jgi:hypothetical protein